MLAADPAVDPRVQGLSSEALAAWMLTVDHCDLMGTDILDVYEVARLDEALVLEWERSALVARLPWGSLRMLELKELWQLDHAA